MLAGIRSALFKHGSALGRSLALRDGMGSKPRSITQEVDRGGCKASQKYCEGIEFPVAHHLELEDRREDADEAV